MSVHNCSTSALHVLSIPHHICQAELAHIIELRRQREAFDDLIKEAESAVRTALEVGAVVEVGIFRAYLRVSGTPPEKSSALIISA